MNETLEPALTGKISAKEAVSLITVQYFFLFCSVSPNLWSWLDFCLASPYTNSTPNISSVRNADSRGSLISTDSGNSLPERNSEKSNSLDKVISFHVT